MARDGTKSISSSRGSLGGRPGRHVLEADHALDALPERAVERGDRDRFDVVFGVWLWPSAESRLELRQLWGRAGLAHVVVAALRGARVLDGELVQKVVGARGSCEFLVHDAACVVGTR